MRMLKDGAAKGIDFKKSRKSLVHVVRIGAVLLEALLLLGARPVLADSVTVNTSGYQIQINLGTSVSNGATAETTSQVNQFQIYGTGFIGAEYDGFNSLLFNYGAANQSVTLNQGAGDVSFSSSLSGPIVVEGTVTNALMEDDSNGGTSFDYSNFVGSATLNNYGSATDTIVVSQNADYTLSDSSLSSTQGLGVSLSGIGVADLTITGGSHTIDDTSWTGILNLTNTVGATLTLTNQLNLGASGVLTNGGTLQIGSGGTDGSINGGAPIVNQGTVIFDNSSTTVLPTFSTIGTLLQEGTGTLVITGTLNLTSTDSLTNTSTVQLGNGSSGFDGTITGTGTVINNGSLVVDNVGTTTLSTIVSGSGGLTQEGTGLLIVTGTQAFTGGTTVSSGTMQLGTVGVAGSLAGLATSNNTDGGNAVTVNDGATLLFVNGTITGGSATSSYGGRGQGDGGVALTFTGTGTLDNPGTIAGGNGGAGASNDDGGAGGMAITFGGAGVVSNTGTITGGSGGVGNVYEGGGGNGAIGLNFGSTGTLTNNSGAIISGGAGGDSGADENNTDNQNGGNGAAAVNFATSGELTNSGTLSGGHGGNSGDVLSTTVTGGDGGSGVVFGGTGSVTNLTGGTISGANGGSSGQDSAGTGGKGGNGVEFQAGGALTNSGLISGGNGNSAGGTGGAGGAGVYFGQSGTVINNATITAGSGRGGNDYDGGDGGDGVHFTTSGTLTNNSGATITAGDGGSSFALYGGSGGAGVSFGQGGTLINNAGATISGGQGGADNGTNNGANGAGVSFSGGIGNLINAGTINGGVTMGDYANTVTLYTGSSIQGDLNMSTNTGAILTLDGTGTQTYSDAVTGGTTLSGTLVKQGTGTWTIDKSLSVANVAVNGGQLSVASSASINILGGSMTVGSGGIFGGAGSINGDLTIQSGGKLYPGDPTVTTVNGNVTLDSGATSAFSIANTTTPSGANKVTAGTDYDQVSIRDTSSASNLTIQSGVTLEIDSISSLSLNSVAYVPAGPNTGLTNYYLYALETGTVSGQFDFLSDGTTTTSITYTDGIGEATLDGITIFLSYTGDLSTNSTIGGYDVVLTPYSAVPEPSTWLLLGVGLSTLVFWRKRSSRRVQS